MSSTEEASPLGMLVRALAIASKRLAAYPAGHPALAGALEEAHRRLLEMTGPTGELMVAVSRDGLLCGDEKLKSPHARSLAAALYQRGVATVGLERGMEPGELESFLRILGSSPAKETRHLWDELAALGVGHVHLRPVDFSAVRMTDGIDVPAAAPRRAGELWDALLRALLAGEELSPEGGQRLTEAAPHRSDIAALIESFLHEIDSREGPGSFAAEDPRAADADFLPARLAEAVRGRIESVRGVPPSVVIQQIAELIRALPQDLAGRVLEAALRALAGEEGTGDLLQALASAGPPEATVRALRKLGSEGVKMSPHALQLLESLSAASREDAARVPSPLAIEDEPSFAELSSILREDDIDRFNPDDHRVLLDHASIELFGGPVAPSPYELGDRIESLTEEVVADRLSQSLVELVVRFGTRPGVAMLLGRLEILFRLALHSERVGLALQIVESLQGLTANPESRDELRGLINECLGRLASPEAIGLLIRASLELSGGGDPRVRRLIERLGSAAIDNLLSALTKEDDQTRRRHIFNLLASLGPAIVPGAVRYLADPRWFVVRNMIVLLRTVGDRSSLSQVRRCAYHADLRVRLEAIKTLLVFEAGVPLTLLARAINDPDPKLAETAVVLSGDYGIAEAVGPLVQMLRRWDLLGLRRSIRLSSIRALGQLGDPAALPRLGRFFKDWIVPIVAREERIAAWRSLEEFPEPSRRLLVGKGLVSRDPEIREICRRLADPAPSSPSADSLGDSTLGRRGRRTRIPRG